MATPAPSPESGYGNRVSKRLKPQFDKIFLVITRDAINLEEIIIRYV